MFFNEEPSIHISLFTPIQSEGCLTVRMVVLRLCYDFYNVNLYMSRLEVGGVSLCPSPDLLGVQ